MKSGNSLTQQFFTTESLKDKEEKLLRLFKDTVKEYHKTVLDQWKNVGNSWPIKYKPIQNYTIFNNYKITFKSDNDRLGSVLIRGKQNENLDRTLKITFLLDTDKLVYKTESFIEYSAAECFLIKSIFSRLEIKTEKDFDLLLNSCEALKISYL